MTCLKVLTQLWILEMKWMYGLREAMDNHGLEIAGLVKYIIQTTLEILQSNGGPPF